MIEFDEYRECTHEIINSINDACNSLRTGIALNRITTVEDFLRAIEWIEHLAHYPEDGELLPNISLTDIRSELLPGLFSKERGDG